ncbi:MAG TPA: hypothetical protein P5244_02470 [Syntrophales bacterium]|nr:hypothetical protein [Syntrophales bacterium]
MNTIPKHKWLKTCGNSPALLLLAMSLWWVLPMFAIHLLLYPFTEYFSSHLLYLIVIGIALLTAAGASIMNVMIPRWEYACPWERYYWLAAAYTVQMIVTLIIALILDAYHLIRYYGGDAAGSIGMLFIPSVLFYFIVGVIGKWVVRLHHIFLIKFDKSKRP